MMVFDGAVRADSKKRYDSNSTDIRRVDMEKYGLSLSATRLEHYMRTEINKDQFQIDIELAV